LNGVHSLVDQTAWLDFPKPHIQKSLGEIIAGTTGHMVLLTPVGTSPEILEHRLSAGPELISCELPFCF
jgi:hypothetical protein